MHPSGRPPATSARLRAAAAAEPTYRDVGATDRALPAGCRHVRRVHAIGTGAEVFRSAAERLLTWDMHRAAGLHVEATTPAVTLGSTAVLRTWIGPLRVVAPCRVVTVVDTPDRRGFAYGTLPGHPEQGEELFVVTIDGGGRVRLGITAFSRPGTWWARAGGPLTRRVQDRLTDRYVAALTTTHR